MLYVVYKIKVYSVSVRTGNEFTDDDAKYFADALSVSESFQRSQIGCCGVGLLLTLANLSVVNEFMSRLTPD